MEQSEDPELILGGPQFTPEEILPPVIMLQDVSAFALPSPQENGMLPFNPPTLPGSVDGTVNAPLPHEQPPLILSNAGQLEPPPAPQNVLQQGRSNPNISRDMQPSAMPGMHPQKLQKKLPGELEEDEELQEIALN